MNAALFTEKYENYLLVEGRDDKHVFYELLKQYQILKQFETIPDGTIIKEDGLPNVGIWLMPDNKIPGMLEDFVSFLLPPGDLLWPVAEDILQKVVEQDCRFRPTYRIEAKIHTWLAWQKEPGKPLGQAITATYFNANAPHAQELIDWIRRLFVPEPV
jgi:hypothetical protein